jgi:hypothetical protein
VAHAQQQILDAIQALLAAGDTAAGERVDQDRLDTYKPARLPAIAVSEADAGEDCEPSTIGGLERRELSVLISPILVGSPSDARAFGLAVEKLVYGSTSLQALCKFGWRISNNRPVSGALADQKYCGREQLWLFTYLVNPATPDVIA